MRGWRLAVALPLLSGVHAGAFTASEATAQSFDDLVGGARHALVEFYAPWCDACSAFAPVLREAAAELARERGDVVLVRVDGDAQPQLRSRLQVAEAPSVLLFARGSQRDAEQPEAERFTGALNRAALLGWARGALPPVSEPPAAAGRAARAARTSPTAPPETDDGRVNARAQQTADTDEVAARLLDVLRAGGGAWDGGD